MHRDEIAKKLLSLGLIAEPGALSEIAATQKPLELCKKLKQGLPEGTEVVTRRHVLDLIKTPEVRVLKPPKPRPEPARIRIKQNFTTSSVGSDIQNFIRYFNSRYEKLSAILRPRTELAGAVSISNLPDAGDATAIGVVNTVSRTKKGNLRIVIEDPTGQVPVIIGNFTNQRDLFHLAENVVADEVIGIAGRMWNKMLLCSKLIQPDIPVRTEKKKVEADAAVAFISDTHIGSNKFTEKELLKMINWLKGKADTQKERELASRINCVLVAGDIIDGVGIYPGQENELSITDLDKQFEEAAQYFEQLPDHIQIIISPGNHDSVRLQQPQPPLDRVTDAFSADNITLVSNPATIQLYESIDVLMYHGASFDNLISTAPALANGYSQPNKVMEALLKKRHLAPIYGGDLAPEIEDRLVIETVPDIIHCGHVHTNGQSRYRGTLIINSGAWQEQTSFQKMVGHTPTPCQMPVFDFHTGTLHKINFK